MSQFSVSQQEVQEAARQVREEALRVWPGPDADGARLRMQRWRCSFEEVEARLRLHDRVLLQWLIKTARRTTDHETAETLEQVAKWLRRDQVRILQELFGWSPDATARPMPAPNNSIEAAGSVQATEHRVNGGLCGDASGPHGGLAPP